MRDFEIINEFLLFAQIWFGCFDVRGFKGGKVKRNTATGKNQKFVIIIFTCACRVL